MKETGIKGIGQVPDCWRLQQLGVFFSEVKEKNDSFLCDMPLQFKMGEIIRKPERQSEISEDEQRILEAYTIVKPDDIVINGLNLNFDFNSLRIAKVKDNGIITSAYIIIRPRKEGISSYFNYLLKALDSQKIFHGMGEGLRLTLKYKEVKSMILPTPSFEEQQRIANFLDQKCAEVDDLIALQESMITELQAYKQSVITETVTRGLDPNAPLKDSGVEWIGKIPQHWEVMKLKKIIDGPLQYGANESGVLFNESLPRYVRITDINENTLREDLQKLSLTEEQAKQYLLKDGDVLFARSGGTVGKAFIYKSLYGRCAFAGYLIKAHVNANNLPMFLYYHTQSYSYAEWKNRIFIQSTIQNIGADKYSIMEIPICSLEEQIEIVNYLDERCADIDALIQTKREKIESLKEYRKSIIYEYVTGKKQV